MSLAELPSSPQAAQACSRGVPAEGSFWPSLGPPFPSCFSPTCPHHVRKGAGVEGPGQLSRDPGHNWGCCQVGLRWVPLGVVRRFGGTRQLHR